jgi:predicted porin
MKGGFGNFFIGNWDAPFKRTSGPWSVGSNETGIWGSSFLLTGGSTTTDNPPTGATPARGTFKRRQNSLLTYDSPDFGGFQVMAAFSAAQNATGTLANASNNKARILSIGGQYSAGPLFIGAGYEKHLEFNSLTGGRDGDDTGWHIGGAYTWGPVRFGGGWTKQKFETGTTAAPTESHVAAWHIGVDWRIVGPHGLRASYTKAGDMKGTPGAVAIAGNGATRPAVPALGAPNDTGASLWTIRYVYTFSKRTEFNFGYARLDNDGNAVTGGAQYAIGGGTSPGLHAPGGSQYAWGASMRHSF